MRAEAEVKPKTRLKPATQQAVIGPNALMFLFDADPQLLNGLFSIEVFLFIVLFYHKLDENSNVF